MDPGLHRQRQVAGHRGTHPARVIQASLRGWDLCEQCLPPLHQVAMESSLQPELAPSPEPSTSFAVGRCSKGTRVPINHTQWPPGEEGPRHRCPGFLCQHLLELAEGPKSQPWWAVPGCAELAWAGHTPVARSIHSELWCQARRGNVTPSRCLCPPVAPHALSPKLCWFQLNFSSMLKTILRERLSV